MIVIDSSVAIAAFSSWHEQHHSALKVLDEQPRLACHAAIETYSVLTRLPPPHRASGDVVRGFLRDNFEGALVGLSPTEINEFLGLAEARHIVGGATYDAMVAYTALLHDAELVTADVRATRTYDAIGVRHSALG